ncbi:MAG: PAS domain-containing protein [Sulfuricurvum sp.]|uniref:PAS domain-containing protein n=1 Tax=Sulfuricurvum sp. TaxID=2025608 RepID=UPI0026051B01|nr:PAS domain-containing protein [Sulfuricurvum sp.]MDD2368377.1 PAS domain-containing protein [Sulfuricurvum sp.]MDD2950721.1 PAS domain-containing protein [Sulfuricurvum sp.]MDD5117394.1 PAS domain-containing protein [Sulfuricurvum sp.]
MSNKELTFGEEEFIVSKTDLNGKITYGNSLFIQMSGYSELELIDKPHNILRHEDMPAVIFKLLWSRIKAGKEIFAYVKNKTQQGDYYWVFAHVTPSFDTNRAISNYHSVRRKPSEKALNVIRPLYATLLQKEREGGVAASESVLNQLLKDKGMSYDEFILSL